MECFWPQLHAKCQRVHKSAVERHQKRFAIRLNAFECHKVTTKCQMHSLQKRQTHKYPKMQPASTARIIHVCFGQNPWPIPIYGTTIRDINYFPMLHKQLPSGCVIIIETRSHQLQPSTDC